MLRKYTAELTPSGAAENATAEQTISLHGLAKIYSIRVVYTSQPATTELEVSDGETDGGGGLDLKLTGNTNKVLYPRSAAAKSAEGGASTLTEVSPVSESLLVKVAKGSAGGIRVEIVAEA